MKGANKEIELFTKSDKTKERPYALNLFFVLFVAISAFTATIAFRPIDQLPEKPLNEDGYYALTVARNLADGHWFSYDGTNKSNGFQPLFTAICAIPHLLAGNNAL